MARMTKVLISMPPELVEQIDAEAKRRGVSRSELIRVAARSEARLPTLTPAERQEVVDAIKRGAAKVETALGGRPLDGTAFIRWDRDHGHSV